MEGTPVITVDSVGKAYLLGQTETGGRALLSEQLGGALRSPGRLLRKRRPPATQDLFWALRNVSLEVAQGEVVGLVGSNGAGKSTLLKLLSRITPPTEGGITMRGRVATMLEVGTGFHPELTGRENVFLNGTILGMRRREVEARFDEIVEFSGVERFIDTPVKRYSSGMYVRLAFAVAAHLEPEILLIDEVLAVGDAAFQRKSLAKMREVVADDGRTIVFVSHNLSAVQRLCTRSFWIDGGRIGAQGPTQDVIAAYLQGVGSSQRGGRADIGDDVPRVGNGEARLRHVSMLDAGGRKIEQLMLGQRFSLRLGFEVNAAIEDAVLEVGICSADGSRVVTAMNTDGGRPALELDKGMWDVEVDLDVTLLPGDFTVDVGIYHMPGLTCDYLEQVFAFAALNVAQQGDDRYPWNVVRGSVRAHSEWQAEPEVAGALR
jgi:lipopolysaccharide transport system ATP-binding protein